MHLKPILNTSLPQQFRQIRLELAREPGHPEGDSGIGYIVIAPLVPDGRIDHASWKEHREACRVTRLRPDGNEDVGHLVHRPGGKSLVQIFVTTISLGRAIPSWLIRSALCCLATP